MFENRVVLDGSQTAGRVCHGSERFENRVVLDGSQTTDEAVEMVLEFENRVVLDGSQTAFMLTRSLPMFENRVVFVGALFGVRSFQSRIKGPAAQQCGRTFLLPSYSRNILIRSSGIGIVLPQKGPAAFLRTLRRVSVAEL